MRLGDQLIEFVKSGDHEAAASLLSQDRSLAQYVNEQGATPLHFATLSGNRSLVSLLVQSGANVNQRDGEFGATPTGWAIESLRQQGGVLAIEIDDLVFAIQRGDTVWAKRLLGRFPSLREETDESGTPILEIAQASGNSEILQLFRLDESEERS